MANPMKKFSAQADVKLLYEVKEIAKKEGKQLQVIINEAFEDLVEKKKQTKPRKMSWLSLSKVCKNLMNYIKI